MSIKMISVDLDGTLYNDDKEITPRTLDSLRRAAAMGIEIVPSTGRPFFGIPDDVRSLDFVNYYITCNGAALYDRNGKCIFESSLDTALSAELAEKLCSPQISLDAFIGGNAYRNTSGMDIIDHLDFSAKMKEYIRKTRITVEDLAGFIAANKLRVQKFTANFIPDGNGGYIFREETADMLSAYSTVTDVVCGGGFDLEITEKGVSKGSGVRMLCGIIGADISESMAIGDSENDLEAMKTAGIAVAMGNSEQCILDAADHVTLSNNEDGIAAAIEKFILK